MRRRPLVAGGLVLMVLTLVDAPSPLRLTPALRLRKTVSVDGACPGVERVSVRAATSVTYCYTVTNTGPGPARDVIVTDAGRSLRVGTLQAGQSRTVTGTATVRADAGAPAVASESAHADVDAGSETTVALALSEPSATEESCAGVEVATRIDGATVSACYSIARTADATAAPSTTVVVLRSAASAAWPGATAQSP